MIEKAATAIQKADIDLLIQSGRIEDRTIEYKRVLPGPSDEDRREFLRDVSAFANALGGDILYGIEEDGGAPISAPGISITNFDEVRLRLQSTLQSNLDPRLPAIDIEHIAGFSEGSVVLVRAHQSWRAPHMITFKGLSKFYVRGNGQRHEMDVVDLRAAFVGSEALADRIRSFRDGRIARILSGQSPLKSFVAPTVIFHVIPIDSSFNRADLDVRQIGTHASDLNRRGENPELVYTAAHRPNLDGLLVVSTSYEQHFGFSPNYIQVFRNGGVEFVETHYRQGSAVLNPLTSIDGRDAETQLLNHAQNAFLFRKQVGLSGPVLLSLTLLHVNGVDIMLTWGRPSFDQRSFDRDTVVLNESVVDEEPSDVATPLRTIFDSMWQAAGHQGSYSYDNNGVYIPMRRR
jgi:hypothetical protein